MRLRVIALVVLGVVAAGVGACSLLRDPAPDVRSSPSTANDHEAPRVPTRGTACADGPALAFVATNTGREQIYVLDPSTDVAPVPIVELPGFVSDPAWSPDGRRVAFGWYRQGWPSPKLSMLDADGSHLRLLAREAAMPSWSPDGRFVAFANLRIGSRGISIVEVAKALRGEPAVRVVTRTGDAVPEEQPKWSPDGDRIAFTSHRDGSSDIWTVAVDGSHLRNLTGAELALDTGATWSPDGSLIAFASNRASSTELGGDVYVMRPDGTHVRRLTFDDSAYAPAWSPDGCGIAFNSALSGTSEMYVMRPDGSHVGRLTISVPDARGDPTFACCAAWRPGR